METESKKYAPILPYDVTLRDNFLCYDNTTYVYNRDFIDEYKLRNVSNITKYYSYTVNDTNHIIGGTSQ